MSQSAPSVLIIHNAYRQRGGEESVLAAESALLAARGHRVGRLVVDNREIDDRRGPVSALRLAAETIWSTRGRHLVKRAIDQFRPDVVHVHNTFPRLSPSIYGACRQAGVPVVQSVHNFRLVCPSSTLFRDGRECRDCVGRTPLPAIFHACYRGSRTASATVAAMLTVHRVRRTWSTEVDAYLLYSPWAAELLTRGGLPPDRVHVRSHFVRDRATRDGPGEAFVFVGRLTAEKGVPMLLTAWDRLPGLELRIAGDGPLNQDVAVAAKTRRITALGFIDPDAVHRELLAARALVFTSRTHEMGPLTVIEAYAAGVPVIAPAFGVIASIVQEGVTGLLYAPGDPDSLASAVRWAVEHPRDMEVMGRAARRRFEEQFTEDRSYAALESVYRQVIAEAKAT